MHSLIEWALRYRAIVVIAVLFAIGFGLFSLRRLPIDAVPDITPNQVLILTRAPSLSPIEVEQFLTFPVETAMTGLPGVERIQSVSKNGLSYVAVYFREDVNPYFARQLVMERLPQARENIPAGLGAPEMGPIATGLGEVYQFKVSGAGRSLMELRSILDWEVAPKLRSVTGIVEVNTHGGELKTYEVQIDSSKLTAYQVPLAKLISALEKNNANAGGAYLERNEEQALVRGEALISSLSDIEKIVVGVSPSGTPILVRNLGEVRFAPMVRQGFATQDGKGEIVVGVAMMLVGENSRVVVQRVKEKLSQIQRSLPPGVRLEPLYDRTDLVRRTIGTVTRNLVEGGLLVIAVLLLLLGSLKGGVLVSFAIPLSMLVAFAGMVQANISGNLMSLGAIDFGLIVDGSVVMIENILRRLGHRKPEESPRDVILRAGQEVARPTFFGVMIIALVYVPILTLRGVEGKMFRPMAMTVLFALAASLVIALVVMPALASYFFRKRVAEKETWLMRRASAVYALALRKVLKFPLVTAGVAALIFIGSVAMTPFLGAEFIPTLDEGSIVVMMYRVPGISVAESLHGNEIIETVLREFPEVQTVYCRTGRPEIATDPMAIDQSDVYVFLKPVSQWPKARFKDDLVAAMKQKLLEHAPGAGYSFSQPIQMRMQELMEAGVRSDVAVKLYGEDLDILREKAEQIATVVQSIPGAADVRAERVAGLPYLRLRVRRDALARHDLAAADVLNTVEAIGGKVVGQVVEGNKRFALQIRFEEAHRNRVDAIRNLMIGDEEGHFIPMAQLADVVEETGPAQISRENGQRRISVELNVRGRDLAGFVSAASRTVASKVKLPEGYSIDWGGKFEQFESASRRLAITVPAVLALIFVLLYFNFGSFLPAALISLNVPLAASGGIIALWIRGLPFSISAGVGFIALFGIAVLNGIVLLTHIIGLRRVGTPLDEAVESGARTRLRPVLMTALVASLGFIPMALSHGAGAEVQRPLATVVIGGLVTSTALTLLALPAIYLWQERRRQPRTTALTPDRSLGG